jgi:hypothetical protein
MKRCPVCGGINEDYNTNCKFCNAPLYFVRSFTTFSFGEKEVKGFKQLLRFSSLAILSMILALLVLVPFLLVSISGLSVFNAVTGIGALASAALSIFSLIELKRALVNFSGVRGVYKATIGAYMTLASSLVVFVLPLVAYPVLQVFALPSPADLISLYQSEALIGGVEIVIEIFMGISILLVGIGIHDIGSSFRINGLSNGGIIMAVGGVLIPFFFPISIILGLISLFMTRSGSRQALRNRYAVVYY